MANGMTLSSFKSNNDFRPNHLINYESKPFCPPEPFASDKTAAQLLDETKGNYVKNSQWPNDNRSTKSVELHNNDPTDRQPKCMRTADCTDVNSRANLIDLMNSPCVEVSSNQTVNRTEDKSVDLISLNNNNNSLKDLNKSSLVERSQRHEQTTKLLSSLLNGEPNRPLTSIILSNNLNKKFSSTSNQFAIRSSSPPPHKRKPTVGHKVRKANENEHTSLESQLKLLICIDHDDSHLRAHLPTFSNESSTSDGPSSNCSRPSSICSSPISPPSLLKKNGALNGTLKSGTLQGSTTTTTTTTKSSLLNDQLKSNQKHQLSSAMLLNAKADVRSQQKKPNKSILSTSIQSVNSKLPSLASLSKTSKAILSSKFTSKVCSKVCSKVNAKATTKPSSSKVSPNTLAKCSQASTETAVQSDAQHRPKPDRTDECTDNVIISNQFNHISGLNSLNRNINKSASNSSPPIDTSPICNRQPVSNENQIKHPKQQVEQQQQQLSNLPTSSPVVKLRKCGSETGPIVSVSSCKQTAASTKNQLNSKDAFERQTGQENAASSNMEKRRFQTSESESFKQELKRIESTSKDHELKNESVIQRQPVTTSLEPAVLSIENLSKKSLTTNLNSLNGNCLDKTFHSLVPNHLDSQINSSKIIYDTDTTDQTDCKPFECQANELSGERLTIDKSTESNESKDVANSNQESLSNGLNVSIELDESNDEDTKELIKTTAQAVTRSKSDIGHRADRTAIRSRFKPERVFNTIGLDIARSSTTTTNQQVNGLGNQSLANSFGNQFANAFNHHGQFNNNSFSNMNLYSTVYPTSTYNQFAYQTATVNRLGSKNQPVHYYSQIFPYNCNRSPVNSYYTLGSSPKLVISELNKNDYRLDQTNGIEHRMNRISSVLENGVSSNRIDGRPDRTLDKRLGSMLDCILDNNKMDNRIDHMIESNYRTYLDATTINRNQSSKTDHSSIYLKSDCLNACEDLNKTNQLASLAKSFNSIQLTGDFKSQTNLIANLDPTLATSFNSVSLPTTKPNPNSLNATRLMKPNSLKNNLKALIPEHDLDGEISIIERNARVIKWLYNCKKYYENAI